MNSNICEAKLKWIKETVYRFLIININDPAFEELLEDSERQNILDSVFSQSEVAQRSIFFYSTIIEEEVEKDDVLKKVSERPMSNIANESLVNIKLNSDIIAILEAEDENDALEKAEDAAKVEISDSSVFDRDSLDGNSYSTSSNGKTHDNDMDEDELPAITVNDEELENDSGDELDNDAVDVKKLKGRKMSLKKSTTSFVTIVKKTKLHFCLNVTRHVPLRSYVYFLRRHEGVLPSIELEDDVHRLMLKSFDVGYLSQHPLICIDAILSNLYMPMFLKDSLKAHVSSKDYNISDDQISSLFVEFNKNMKDFTYATKQIISQIQKPFMFSLPEIPEGSSPKDLAQEAVFTSEAMYLVKEWNDILTDLMEEIIHKKPPEKDILQEVEFWKAQKLKVGVCCDQLSHSTIQQTLQILKLSESDIKEFEHNVRNIEVELIKVSSIVDYLLLLELNAKNILTDLLSLEKSKQALDDTCTVLKIICVQSEYYKESTNMSRILRGISILLQEHVKKETRIDVLFKRPLEEASQIVANSIALLKYWKELYFENCEDVKRYGSDYWWSFDTRELFDDVDYMIFICNDLQKILKTLQELYNIFKTNLKFFVEDSKKLDELENRIFGMTIIIQYIFDHRYKVDWEKVVNSFFLDVKNLEKEIKSYMRNMFQKSLSWENAYILSKSFDKLAVSSSIQDFIKESRTDMLKRFLKEITEVENTFLANERDPPRFREIPETASTILWIQDLVSKISHPMSTIPDGQDLSEDEIEVHERFEATEQLLQTYKQRKYESWKTMASDKLNKFLHSNFLTKFSTPTNILVKNNLKEKMTYQVNFPSYFEDVSVEAKLFESLGYDIPHFVQNIVLQEKSFHQFRNKMRNILEDLKRSIDELKREELSTLVTPFTDLCSVLDTGLGIQWESTEIPGYLKRVEQTVNMFRGLITQIKTVTNEIESRIKLLSTSDLFQFTDVKTTAVTCEKYFNAAQMEMDKKVKNVVDIYNSLEHLLKNLEMISCKTRSGKAEQLKEYYSACEEKILMALLKMMLDNLEYFEEEILKHYIFPYTKAAFESVDEMVQSSIIRIKLVFTLFIQYVVESTRNVIRWLNGTCIQSSSFYLIKIKQKMEYSYFLDLSIHPDIKKIVLRIIKKYFSYVDNIKNEKKI